MAVSWNGLAANDGVGSRDAVGAWGYTDGEFLRYNNLHCREFIPTRAVWRGGLTPSAVEESHADLDDTRVDLSEETSVAVLSFLERERADAFVVLHDGAVVYERYFAGMARHDHHLIASITKSIVGLLVLMLIEENEMARSCPIGKYVPELVGTAFGETTVDAALHMATPVRYEGRPYVKEDEAQRFFSAIGIAPAGEAYSGPTTIMERLGTGCNEGPVGSVFRYDNGNAESLGEAIRRVTGDNIARFLSDRIWSKIGAEEDAYFSLDRTGREIACGRVSASARDLARLGELLRCGGAVGPTQVVPERIIAGLANVPPGPSCDVLERGDSRGPDGRAIMGYHDFWWIPYDGHGSFVGHGRYGQRLYVAPALGVVAVLFSSRLVTDAVPKYDTFIRRLGEKVSLGEV